MQIRIPRTKQDRKGRKSPRRIGLRTIFLALAGVVFLAFGVYVAVATGSIAGARERVRTFGVQMLAHMGFRLQNIYVEGRNHLESDTLKAILNMKKGDPLFAFDPDTAHDLLIRVPWVKTVTIRRDLPDTIYIKLDERAPVALWQYNEKVRVVDADGVVVSTDLRPFAKLPLVVGKSAETQAAKLLSMLSAEPEIFSRLESAVWIGERRWDLNLRGGLSVKLPEEDMGLALKRLGDAQRVDRVLDKDLLVIDARENDRLVVRTRGNVTENLQANFKPAPNGRDL